MRVLLLHNRYQIAKGEDLVVHTEKALLQANDHPVALLETKNYDITSLAKEVYESL